MLEAFGKRILDRSSLLTVGAVLAVIAVGLLSGWSWLAPEVRYAFDGDWRHTTAGLQRIPGQASLSGGPVCLVHFHNLDGREGSLSVRASAARDAAPLQLSVVRNGAHYADLTLDNDPRWIRVPIAAGTRDIDLGLVVSPGHPQAWPLKIDEMFLQRSETLASLVRRVLPTAVGIVVLFSCRRRAGLFRALVYATLATVGSSAALAVAFDPVVLSQFRAGLRARFQLSFVAMIALAALSSRGSRLLAAFAIAGTVFTLQLPSLHYGLINDDFVWARPWTPAEVVSAFHGSNDPLGLSNPYFRPLTSTVHAADYVVWGFSPKGYHITNLALAVIAIVLLYELLLRAGLPPLAGLFGALVFAAHPLAASAVSWISQRTDILATIGYLAALAALLGSQGVKPARVLVWAALALTGKECAVTLPIVATAVSWSALPSMEWRRRWKSLRALFYLIALYLGYWAFLFPEALVSRLAQPSNLGGVSAGGPSFWWRWPLDLYAPLFVPRHYVDWWYVPLAEKSLLHLIGGTLLGVAVLVWIVAQRSGSTPHKRLAIVAFLWPLVTILPMTGIRGVDIYRLGFLPAVAVGVFLAIAAARSCDRRVILVPVGAALVAGMGFYAARTSAEWGPGGFYYNQELTFLSSDPPRIAGWPERSRAVLFEQERHRDHMNSPLEGLDSARRAAHRARRTPQ